LRKAVGYESAKLKTSNSAGEAQKQQRIEIPALKIDKSQMLADGIFAEYIPPQPEAKISAMAYARFVGIITGVIFLTLTGLAYWKLQWYAGIPLGLWLLFILMGYFYGKSVELHFSDDFILIKKGFIFKNRVVIPTFKLQAVAIEENIFLKRRKLSHINLYTAAGSKRVKYLSKKDAIAIYDHVLMCVERSLEPWM
jgi:putative membrane protein